MSSEFYVFLFLSTIERSRHLLSISNRIKLLVYEKAQLDLPIIITAAGNQIKIAPRSFFWWKTRPLRHVDQDHPAFRSYLPTRCRMVSNPWAGILKVFVIFFSFTKHSLKKDRIVLHYILYQPLTIPKELAVQMVSIALLNFVLLWDSIMENKRIGDLTIDISGRKYCLLFCAFSEISIIAGALRHIYPTANSVARLSQLWITLYAKNKTRIIKHLQDTSNCCGLVSPTDRAWPFENIRACHEIYQREASCLSSWLASHNRIAIWITITVSITLVFEGIILKMRMRFKKTTYSVFKMYDKISNLDKELESGLYDLNAISKAKFHSTTRESTTKEVITFQNRNTTKKKN